MTEEDQDRLIVNVRLEDWVRVDYGARPPSQFNDLKKKLIKLH